MNRVKVFDTTLRDGEQSPSCSMNLPEKLSLAKQLELLGVDAIEAGFAVASPDDFKSVESVAQTIKNCTVTSLARCIKGDIDAAGEALKDAKYPRIHVFLATSDIHMEYKLKMSRDEVIDKIAQMVAYAKSYCEDIEFSAEDASRSERAFLAKCYTTAIKAGATVINVPDTVGYATPREMYELITYLKANVEGVDDVDISVHCHDDLGLAVANSLSSIRAGATQVECTINGIGERAGNASLEEIVMGLKTRNEYYQATTNIDTKQIYRSSKLLSSIIGVPVSPNKSIVGANAFSHEAGIHQHGVISNPLTYEIMKPSDIGLPKNTMVLGKHSGKHALRANLEEMGYEICNKDLDELFIRFKELADKKKTVTNQDLEALILSQRKDVPQIFELVGHVVNAGSDMPNTACIKIKKDDENFESVAMGDGPIDAAFKAINKIVGLEIRLDSFSLDAISTGEDAIGEAVIKITHDDRQYVGTGMSTDIIEASLQAYINGINKIMSQ